MSFPKPNLTYCHLKKILNGMYWNYCKNIVIWENRIWSSWQSKNLNLFRSKCVDFIGPGKKWLAFWRWHHLSIRILERNFLYVLFKFQWSLLQSQWISIDLGNGLSLKTWKVISCTSKRRVYGIYVYRCVWKHAVIASISQLISP